MPRKRKNETDEERSDRLKKNAHEQRDAGNREDSAMDAMVRKSIKLHGP